MGILSVGLLAAFAAFMLFRVIKALGAASRSEKSRGELAQHAAEDISLAAKIVAAIGGLLAWFAAPGFFAAALIKIGLLAVPTAYFLGPVFAGIATACYVAYAAIKLFRNRRRD